MTANIRLLDLSNLAKCKITIVNKLTKYTRKNNKVNKKNPKKLKKPVSQPPVKRTILGNLMLNCIFTDNCFEERSLQYLK